MSKITALEPDPRRSGTVRIEIDGERFGSVPHETAALEGLASGLVVSHRVAGTAHHGGR